MQKYPYFKSNDVMVTVNIIASYCHLMSVQYRSQQIFFADLAYKKVFRGSYNDRNEITNIETLFYSDPSKGLLEIALHSHNAL